MREIPVQTLSDTVRELYLTANYQIGADIEMIPRQNWESLLLLPCGVLLFVFFLNLDASRWKKTPRLLLAAASELTFGAYLLSCLFDKLIYDYLAVKQPDFFARLPYYPIVFATLLLSLAASYSVTVIWTLLRKAGDAAAAKLKKKQRETADVR